LTFLHYLESNTLFVHPTQHGIFLGGQCQIRSLYIKEELEVSPMVIAERLKALREQKNMSQGDIEKRTGLLRCYISRVENGHTVPAIETLEKMARAMEVPIYVLFYDGEEPPAALPELKANKNEWGNSGRDARMLGNFRRLLSRTDQVHIKLLLSMAQKMAQKKRRFKQEVGSVESY
jgi:transcriptional regulator with XRE-family HTH domain